MINALKYVKKLEEAGVSREQAEIHLQIVTDIMQNNFATQQNMKDLSVELRQDMTLLKQELRHEMSLLEQRMTIKLGTIVSIAIGVAVTLARLVS